MPQLSSLHSVTENSLSTIRRAAITLAPALLFPAALYGASSLPSTVPTSVSVNVTNTPLPVTAPNPLPITGNVGLLGTPTVNLAGPIRTTRVDDPARSAYSFQIPFGGPCLTVPENMRFILEFASASAEGTPDVHFLPIVRTISNGIAVLHAIPVTRLSGPLGSATLAGATPMRGYGDPNSDVCAEFRLPTGFVNARVTISGYFLTPGE